VKWTEQYSELAQRLGLAANAHISLLERGRHEPSIDLVVAIADLFGVTTDYLLHLCAKCIES
jgi:transcriptional regulator with XRE-family HTH domain